MLLMTYSNNWVLLKKLYKRSTITATQLTVLVALGQRLSMHREQKIVLHILRTPPAHPLSCVHTGPTEL